MICTLAQETLFGKRFLIKSAVNARKFPINLIEVDVTGEPTDMNDHVLFFISNGSHCIV